MILFPFLSNDFFYPKRLPSENETGVLPIGAVSKKAAAEPEIRSVVHTLPASGNCLVSVHLNRLSKQFLTAVEPCIVI